MSILVIFILNWKLIAERAINIKFGQRQCWLGILGPAHIYYYQLLKGLCSMEQKSEDHYDRANVI